MRSIGQRSVPAITSNGIALIPTAHSLSLAGLLQNDGNLFASIQHENVFFDILTQTRQELGSLPCVHVLHDIKLQNCVSVCITTTAY